MPDGGSSREDVAARLIMLRRALGFENQNAFAVKMGISPSLWNHYETGRRPLTLDAANKIRNRANVTLDWLLHGDRSGLTVGMSNALPDLSAWRKKQA